MEWLHIIGETFDQAESALIGLGPSAWLLLAALLLSCIDGFFPPVPSESVVIAAAVVGMTGDIAVGFLIILFFAAALGAFLGDRIAYAIGAKVPLHRLPGLRGRRAQATLRYTRQVFAHRGSTLILTGRFVPIGRIAVNMTAGSVGYPLARFLPLAALAALLWAAVAVATGILAGQLLQDSPLLALAVGIGTGVLAGLIIDWLGQQHTKPTRSLTPASTRTDR